MEALGDLLASGPQGMVFFLVRLVQLAVTTFAAIQVVRYGISCLARAYEAILIMLIVLLLLAIGNTIVHDFDSRPPDIVEWGWLVFDIALPLLVLRYVYEQRKYTRRLTHILLRRGAPQQ